jgi:crotonobetainyl-CoA:carnitine CoA-transferase CaiB-like acyl-CoA transferase
MAEAERNLPLEGVRVLELGHAVMGPSCGLILADMGAEVIKIERAPRGDDTRRLPGFGIGLFPYFNRNKKSLALDLKSQEGKEILTKLITESDVVFDNFGPGALDRLGFSYERCNAINPRIIYCPLKGFMPGPYEKRPSLDNLVQMMGGLAYMTGPSGRPLRAGTSVIDIMGGTFGALGIITALYEREKTGRGQFLTATLFEATVFLVGQHMAHAAIDHKPLVPMPESVGPWSIYDLFRTKDGEQIFIGITSDFQWERFCQVFGLDDLKKDDRLTTNNDRVFQRHWLVPRLQEAFTELTEQEVIERAEQASIPFAPIVRPDQLFDDPHLNASGGLVETTFPSGDKTKMPKIPLRMGHYDFGLRNDPPAVGEGSREILRSIGLSDRQIEDLIDREILAIEDKGSTP